MSLTGSEKAHRLQMALECGGAQTHRITDVVEMIKAGRAMLWEKKDGCIITEVFETPLRKSVNYWLIFGDLRDCLALEDEINPWAIEHGCTVALATGRKGWGRVAAPTGWKPWLPNFYKTLVVPDGT